MSELNFTHSNGNKVKLATPDTLTANKTFKLPGADGSSGQFLKTDGSGALSFATPSSSSMIDVWRLTTPLAINSTSGNHIVISANWERPDTAGQTNINGGMSIDSSTGYWTFPSTGIYKVEFNLMAYSSNATRYIDVQTLYRSSAGGSFTTIGRILPCIGIAAGYCSGHMYNVLNVDNISDDALLFRARSYTTGGSIRGNSDRNETHVTFTKLGDI